MSKCYEDEFVEEEIQKLRKDAEFLIKYIDRCKDVGLILSKAWDIETRRKLIKHILNTNKILDKEVQGDE